MSEKIIIQAAVKSLTLLNEKTPFYSSQQKVRSKKTTNILIVVVKNGYRIGLKRGKASSSQFT